MATCPECDAEIEIDDDEIEDLQIGDPIECDDCGSALRVASLEPFELDPDDLDDEDEEDDEKEEKDKDADEGLDELEDDGDDDKDDNWDE